MTFFAVKRGVVRVGVALTLLRAQSLGWVSGELVWIIIPDWRPLVALSEPCGSSVFQSG